MGERPDARERHRDEDRDQDPRLQLILQEVEETFDTHEKCGSRLGGIHFELTGDNVTECIGGGLTEQDLDTRYMTTCDPPLELPSSHRDGVLRRAADRYVVGEAVIVVPAVAPSLLAGRRDAMRSCETSSSRRLLGVGSRAGDRVAQRV